MLLQQTEMLVVVHPPQKPPKQATVLEEGGEGEARTLKGVSQRREKILPGKGEANQEINREGSRRGLWLHPRHISVYFTKCSTSFR